MSAGRRAVPSLPTRSLRIARIAGIPVQVSASWLLVLALVVWSLSTSYFPMKAPAISVPTAWGLGLAAALLLCVSIVAHEVGHALAAHRDGIAVVRIDLWLLGGMATLERAPRRAAVELRFALAGPAVSGLLSAGFAALWLLATRLPSTSLRALIEYGFLVNVSLLGFNLLPAFPLDGARILRAALWRRSGFDRATELAAQVGRGLGLLLASLGAVEFGFGFAGGLWSVAIGLFLMLSGRAEAEHARLHAASTRLHAATMMSRSVITIAGSLTVQQAAESFFLPYHYTAFPVTGADSALLGVVTIGQAEKVPRRLRTVTRVAEVTDCDPALVVDEDFTVADLLDRPAFARVGRAVVVDGLGSPVGLISLADIQHCIRALRLASPPRSRRGAIRWPARRSAGRTAASPRVRSGAIAGSYALPGVLLADDDVVVRTALSFQLERQFSIVGAAPDADTAVALARQGRPDVAVLDIEMPGGGLEATRRIARESPETAIVVLTADDSSQAVLRFVEAGAVSFLRKGIAVPELAARLLEAIATHRRRLDDGFAPTGGGSDGARHGRSITPAGA